jgi:hypothetical protein
VSGRKKYNLIVGPLAVFEDTSVPAFDGLTSKILD